MTPITNQFAPPERSIVTPKKTKKTTRKTSLNGRACCSKAPGSVVAKAAPSAITIIVSGTPRYIEKEAVVSTAAKVNRMGSSSSRSRMEIKNSFP